MDQLFSILLLVLGVIALLVVLKVAAQVGVKIVTCGCLLIIIVAAVLILMGAVELPPLDSLLQM